MLIRTKFTLVTLTIVCGLAVFAATAGYLLCKLEVNGPIYQTIKRANGVLADILPPPAFIVELHLVTGEALNDVSPDAVKTTTARIADLQRQFEDSVTNWEKALPPGEMRSVLIDQIEPPARQYFSVLTQQFLPKLAQETVNSAKEIRQHQLQELFRAHRAGVDKLVSLATDEATQAEQQANLAITTGTWTMIIIGTTVLVVLVTTMTLITRNVTSALLSTVTDLTTCSAQTRSTSSQVAAAAQQLADGTSQNAAALEETGASLEEMMSLMKTTASNTASAATLANEGQQAGERGVQAMNDLATSINDIKINADQTAKIIRTIDEIAFQTNLLALNAAVEAARAGDAGKSFAVVADEVRKLSQRAGTAARDTAQLIEQSVKSANAGVVLYQKVNEVVSLTTATSKRVNHLVSDISNSAREVALGIENVTTAVRQMDKVTQINAAAAEENSAVGEELSAQSASLNDMVATLEAMVRVRQQ